MSDAEHPSQALRPHGTIVRSRLGAAALVALVVLAAGCGSSGSETSTKTTSANSNSTTSTTLSASSTTADSAAATDLTSGFEQAAWGDNVTVTVSEGVLRFQSDGLPNHDRDAEYALPNQGVRVPGASTAVAGEDPTVAQSYDYSIPLTPTKVAEPTSTSLGLIGVMISGAGLFNPYEGDGSTVATASNFSVKNANGDDVWFLDDCAGHPTPMGQYHYHALPKCVTAQVDTAAGPSHIIGVAFDGYPIYGDRDVDGKQLTKDDLDECNGITSETPEFPDGVYHYVLLDTADSTSSIRCFSGQVDESLSTMTAMPAMGAMPGAG